jgi:hypothetical protein
MSLPAYFNKKDSIKKTANKKEEKVYKHLCSGALTYKGDFSDANAVIDNKSTRFKSIKITEEMLQKIMEDAVSMGKENAVIVIDLPNYYVVGKITKKLK